MTLGVSSSPAPPSVLFVGAFVPGSQGTRGISEDVAFRLSAAGWPVHLTTRKASRFGRLADMLLTARRERHNYDVAAIDVYSGAAFFWAEAVCWMLRRLGKPFILMLHGGNLPAFSASRKERVKRLLSSAAFVTAPSRYLLDRMREYRSDILLIPNAIDLGVYPLSARTAAPSRIVWMRAFHDTYNPDLAIHAIKCVLGDFPNVHLTMAGPDKRDGSLDRVKNLVEELGLSSNVTIVGSVPKKDVPALLASNNIFLNTTRTDNTPVSVIEAMACGLSIVSTNVGGVPYLLENERNALLVPSEDVFATAAALARILRDNAFSNTIAAQARRDADHFDWKIVIPQWQRLFLAASSPASRAAFDSVSIESRSPERDRPLPSAASEQRA